MGFLSAALITIAAQPAGADPAVQASELAAPCASCHRADGRDSGIPPISGMDQRRLLQRMAAFRQDNRGGQIMHVVASALTPAETALLAQYFAAQR